MLAGVPESMKKPYMLRRPDIVALLAECASSPEPEVEEPVPDARIAPVESYLRTYLAPLLTALNAVRTSSFWLRDLPVLRPNFPPPNFSTPPVCPRPGGRKPSAGGRVRGGSRRIPQCQISRG